ncbi:MAG TPA: SDR family NAD(P)-dependent oxidoreductase, partial [Hellea balneolensis]|nr:SDR family NAD(P)-dependent oxidoreductase [Hellea balneolensis]
MRLKAGSVGLSVSIRALEMSKKNRIDLYGKTILITGAGSGIGAASARALYAKGANVVLLDLTDLGTKPLEKEFGAARSLALIADVTKREQLDGAVKTSIQKFGGIDIVFANAGIACDPPTTVRCMSDQTFEHIIEVDLFGVTRTVQAC